MEILRFLVDLYKDPTSREYYEEPKPERFHYITSRSTGILRQEILHREAFYTLEDLMVIHPHIVVGETKILSRNVSSFKK
jgi:hypothetical protein